MAKPFNVTLTPDNIAALQHRFRLGTEADVLASMTPAAATLVEEQRERQKKIGVGYDAAHSYMLYDGKWLVRQDNDKVTRRAAYPGAGMRFDPMYRQILAVDAALYGPHPNDTSLRIVEQISRIKPGMTQRVMILHGDMPPELWGDRHHGLPVSYHPQDRYAALTAQWLRDFKGKKDAGFDHIRRNILLRDRSSPPQQLDQGDAAYQRWYKSPRVQARLWAAPPLSLVHARVGQPHEGRIHPGRPQLDEQIVWKVFSRVIVYRPGQF